MEHRAMHYRFWLASLLGYLASSKLAMEDRKTVSQLLAIGEQTSILFGIVAFVVLVLFA
jgi:hypothetical protein